MGAGKFETLTLKIQTAFPEYEDPPSEPMPLARRWLDDAVRLGVREPRALALATADRLGRASTRVIAFTELSDRGVAFTTHSTSPKSLEIEQTGWASGLLYWRETGQQLMISGPVKALPDEAVDRLWNARPIPLHAMSAVSEQSRPLEDVEGLRRAAAELEADGRALPRPERFVAYLIEAAVVEFWAASPDRLHRRLRYEQLPDGSWTHRRLQP